jgi:hypothetical protein
VHDVRSVFAAACLTASVILCEAVLGPASAGTRNYSAPTNHSKASAQGSTQGSAQGSSSQVPANCIREACGRLWCWKMK